MGRERTGRAVRRIKQMVGSGLYRFSSHALDEMEQDHVFVEDVFMAIRGGRLSAKLTDDPRGPR